MKIKTFISFEDEVTVDIDIDDIRCALNGEVDSLSAVFDLLNSTASFLKGIPDEIIEEANTMQRLAVFELLQAQADRWRMIGKEK